MEKVNSKVSKPVIVFLIVMTVLSFSNCVKIEIEGDLLKLAGFTVLVGIAAYFTTRNTNEHKNAGLNIIALPGQLKDVKVIILILIPTAMNIIGAVKKERTNFSHASQPAFLIFFNHKP